MGLLDSVIGGVLGQVLGGGRGGSQGGSAGGAMSPIVKALLMLLLAKGASGGLGGGLGGVFGGGNRRPEPGPDTERSGGAGPYGRDPGHSADEGGGRDPGDIGGFDQEGGRRHPSLPPGDYSDLSGMLDGPNDGANVPQKGTVSHETSDALGGLDGLVDRFRQGGLGDVIGSWIGNGANQDVSPDHLGRALGPAALDTLQRETGLGRDDLLGQLANVLPEVVSRLTPDGRVPREDERRIW